MSLSLAPAFWSSCLYAVALPRAFLFCCRAKIIDLCWRFNCSSSSSSSSPRQEPIAVLPRFEAPAAPSPSRSSSARRDTQAMHMGCRSHEEGGGGGGLWPSQQARNARSLDVGPSSSSSSSREASKAAAWVWHMHMSCSPSKQLPDHSTAWESQGRSSSSSNFLGRPDSRFRQEAASTAPVPVRPPGAPPAPALGRGPASPPPPPPPTPPPPPQDAPGRLWDCGSELYDTFELVSVSNSLDRSLLVGAVPSPRPEPADRGRPPSPPRFPGLRRTFSLPTINISAQAAMPIAPPSSAGSAHGPPRADLQAHSFNALGGRPSADTHPTPFPLHRSLTPKWAVSKLVHTVKRLARSHTQLDCFGSNDAIARIFKPRGTEREEGDGGLPRPVRPPGLSSSGRNARGSRYDSVKEEDSNGGEEFRCRDEEKVKWRCGKHLYHHHHHYHHHFVHYVDKCRQAADERDLGRPPGTMDFVGAA